MLNLLSFRVFSYIFILTFFYSGLFGQSVNLVNNPGFEEFEKCPQNFLTEDGSHKFIPGWSYPTLATPDYFNRCGGNNVKVPKNFAGESDPVAGDAYAGAILSGTDDGYREYLQGSLSKPLEAGKLYCVTFSYRLASYSKFAVDQLGFYFSDTDVKNQLKVNLPYKPQINSTPGLFLDNLDEWEEICTIYTANGGEQFFIIGNFKSYENTNYVATDKNIKNLQNKQYAYYYFDEFIVKPLENCTDCGCVHHDFEAEVIDTFFTGGYDPFTGKIKKNIHDGSIKIGMVGGTPPYRVEWSDGNIGAEIKGLAAGEYVYTAYDSYNCQSTGKVKFELPAEQIDVFKLGLENIKEGGSIVLENIFFEFNKSTLLPESYPELDKVVKFILEQNIQLIEISGHTDSDGSDTYNQKLSESRARSVVQYLSSKGVPAASMKAVGYGEAKPLDTNFKKDGMAQNRRVEFTLLKK